MRLHSHALAYAAGGCGTRRALVASASVVNINAPRALPPQACAPVPRPSDSPAPHAAVRTGAAGTDGWSSWSSRLEFRSSILFLSTSSWQNLPACPRSAEMQPPSFRDSPTTPVRDRAVIGRVRRRDPAAFPGLSAGRRSRSPFGICSGFTRVAARQLADPPAVGRCPESFSDSVALGLGSYWGGPTIPPGRTCTGKSTPPFHGAPQTQPPPAPRALPGADGTAAPWPGCDAVAAGRAALASPYFLKAQ